MGDQLVTLENAGTYITKLRGPFWGKLGSREPFAENPLYRG